MLWPPYVISHPPASFGDFFGGSWCVFALREDPFLLGRVARKQGLAHAYRFVNLNIKETQWKERACLCSAGRRCELSVSH